MVKIRLTRTGRKNLPSYRIVAIEHTKKRDGQYIEILGFYNPHSKEKQIQAERVKFWVSKGAQLSPTLHNMFVDAGIVTGEKVKVWKPKKGKAGEVKIETKTAPEPVKEEMKEEIAV